MSGGSSRPQGTELLEDLQDVNIDVRREQQRLQCLDVAVHEGVVLQHKRLIHVNSHE